ncbi:MAG: hypothetical protein WCD76_13760 [Pyrinomonadaceae bacterium]
MYQRLSVIAFCLLLCGTPASASPCSRVKSQPGAWVTAEVNALVSSARGAYERDEAVPRYERVVREIVGTLQRCKLSQDEDFVKRYRRFVEYVEVASLDRQPDHELGFNVPDAQYFAETKRYVEIPEFLLAESFFRLVGRYETLDRAKAYLRSLNSQRAPSDQLIFFSYKSQHLGAADNDDSFLRLLIVVPGSADAGVPEKWVQFGIPDPGARTHIRNVSIVSAVPGKDGASDIYFKDFFRTYRRDGSVTIKGRWELGEGDDNCVSCHKSGILPIFPVAGSVSRSERQALEAVNERFLNYGPPRFGAYLNTNVLGPGLGAASAEDRAQRFGANFSETRVAHAMNCSTCHLPSGLGSFNWPMDRVVVNSYIEGGQMPLGQRLSAPQREDLYRKLVQEYFAVNEVRPGILKSWLLDKPQ